MGVMVGRVAGVLTVRLCRPLLLLQVVVVSSTDTEVMRKGDVLLIPGSWRCGLCEAAVV